MGKQIHDITTGAGPAVRTASLVDRQPLRRLGAWLEVAGLMLVGLGLRLPALRIGVWRDEASTYFDVSRDTLGELLRAVAFTEITPPGFFVVMHYWMKVFGSSELALKMPALIFGLLLIPAVYVLGTTVARSSRVGLAAAAAATFASEATFYSQEARAYTLTALLSCLVVLFYVQALGTQRRTLALSAFVGAAVLLLYVHYTGLVLIAALGAVFVCLWWLRVPDLRPRSFIVAFAVIALLFLPGLREFLVDLATGPSWANKEAWWMRPRLVVNNLIYAIPIPAMGGMFNVIRRACILLIAGGGLVAALRWRPLSSATRDPILLNGGVVCVTLLLTSAMLAGLSYERKFMFPFSPMGWVLVSWLVVAGLDQMRRLERSDRVRLGQGVLVAAAAAVLVVPNLQYAASLAKLEKSGVRRLATDLRRTDRGEVLYVVSPDVYAPTLGYYTAHEAFQLHGFPRWTNPQVFSPHGYRELWDAPTLVSDAADLIRRKADEGYRQLALIEQSGPICDSGQLRMSRAQELFAHLRDRYVLTETRDYPGWVESVTLYRFALDATAPRPDHPMPVALKSC